MKRPLLIAVFLLAASTAHAACDVTGYLYYMTFKPSGGSGTLSPIAMTNFTDLVVLTNTNFVYAHANGSGTDIQICTDDLSTAIMFERESWGFGGNSYIWVLYPSTLASDTTTTYRLYYGNASPTDHSNPAATWAGTVSARYGLTNSFADSTANGNNATNNGTAQVPGIAGNGAQFVTAEADFISIPNSATLSPGSGNFTIEMWINRGTTGVTHELYDDVGAGTDNANCAVLSSNVLRSFFRDGSGNVASASSVNTIGAGTYTHVACEWNATTHTTSTFINGVADTTNTNGSVGVINTSGGTGTPHLGSDSSGTVLFFGGNMDEPRIWKRTVPSNELFAEVLTVNQNAGYHTFGAEVVIPVGTPTNTPPPTATPTRTFTITPTTTPTPAVTPTPRLTATACGVGTPGYPCGPSCP